MIYPVGDGTKQTFENLWYVANPFGHQETYGYHEGADINLKTGGDTDLGQELKSIARGQIVYYHTGHATTANTFGRHLVYRIEGAWGTRWIHYAHCLDLDFHGAVQDVIEGQLIARIGKSGTTAAHLHMAIYKIDPSTVGIDNIANNLTELNQYWEDPITFLSTWTAVAPTPVPSPVTDQSKYDFGPDFGVMELQAARSTMQSQKVNIANLNTKIGNARTALG